MPGCSQAFFDQCRLAQGFDRTALERFLIGYEHAEGSQFALDLAVAADDAAQGGRLGQLFARGKLFDFDPNTQFTDDVATEGGNALGVKALALFHLVGQVEAIDDVVESHRLF